MTRRAALLEIVVRTLYPVMLVISVWVLLRGHNQPGGGFIGGMIAVSATAIRAIAAGAARAEHALPIGPPVLAAAGVLLSLGSGLPALASGRPFLTHLWATVPLGVTTLDVSTVFVFDLGVYLTVWGALGGIAARMIALDEQEADQ